MSKITPSIESWVIDEYSKAQTLDEVAEITNLSKGSVYNIIKKRKGRLGEGNIDEVRKFRSLLKKSGLTIEDCALGCRMINMLDKFKLHDDFEKTSHRFDIEWISPRREDRYSRPRGVSESFCYKGFERQ